MKEKMVALMNLTNRCLLVGLLVLWALCSHAEIAADEFPSAADEREEILTTWRLLERDIKYWNVVRPNPRPNTVAPCYQPPADQVANAESLITSKDRDPLDVVLRRTRALAEDLRGEIPSDGKAGFALLLDELSALEGKAAAVDPSDDDSRYLLFSKTLRLRRKIAFSNPLVQAVRKLLFITREVAPVNEFTWGVHDKARQFVLDALGKTEESERTK